MTIENDHRQPDNFSPRQNQPSPNPQTQSSFNAASFVSLFRSTRAKIAGLVCLSVLLIAVAAASVFYRHNAAIRQNAANLNPHSSFTTPFIPKPSPIKRAQPSSPAQPLPAPAFHAPAPVIAVQSAPVAPPPLQYHSVAAPPPVAPPVQAERFAPNLPFGVRLAADRDGFSNGCRHGALVMQPSTISFTCPHDSNKSVAVSVRQVRDLDGNGIVVFPGQKYHFDIAGKQKQAVHELFALWLANARRAASERASN